RGAYLQQPLAVDDERVAHAGRHELSVYLFGDGEQGQITSMTNIVSGETVRYGPLDAYHPHG
ncbi:MAG: hypothetical protein ABJF23_12275, partial [Bryobacteraceae bacterium]